MKEQLGALVWTISRISCSSSFISLMCPSVKLPVPNRVEVEEVEAEEEEEGVGRRTGKIELRRGVIDREKGCSVSVVVLWCRRRWDW